VLEPRPLRRVVLDFYTTGTDTITRAIAELQATHAAATAGHRDQLTAVTRDLKQAHTSIDRYLTAFEKGTLDDADDNIRHRLAALKQRTKQLRGRKAQLEFELDQPPQSPTPGDLAKIRNQIEEVLRCGTPNARKALFEGLIHEIEVLGDGSVRPHFRVPLAGEDEGFALQGPAPVDDNARTGPVRALPRMVDRRLQHKNTLTVATGPDLQLPVARERQMAGQATNRSACIGPAGPR
jgi:site-specific DNA recombinase